MCLRYLTTEVENKIILGYLGRAFYPVKGCQITLQVHAVDVMSFQDYLSCSDRIIDLQPLKCEL